MRDQAPTYRYLRTVLQALTWLRGGTRWVLKSPQHLEQLGPLVSVFPDATFVITHRDPVEITASVLTMLAYTVGDAYAAVDIRKTRVAFRVRNITNEKYAIWADPGYADQILLAAPRSYELSAAMRF